jgi:hypothetical protein
MERFITRLVAVAIVFVIALAGFGVFGLVRHLILYGIDGSADCG